MQRINRIDPNEANANTQEILTTVKTKMGVLPNIIATLANSESSLIAYLNFSEALAHGELSAALKEQIALSTAGANDCDYCASAHTFIGANVGLDAKEMRANLSGDSSSETTQKILYFVNEIIAKQGRVATRSVQILRDAGLSDGIIIEIFANTVLNIFTNYFNHLAETEIDFPEVSANPV
ncbi:carboxymuconolactone decarboxylase family protein [Kangiella sp. TOML190]|uniref:carboxymuconolactone decarboxylase family protein n=1 Tax=Kangiella sp. TOML190 TaxID=2931351 RepID=UPI00203FD469|nr:carboxymuconolactone decarboxylase family protein [Kangiella sp. TOML190]